MADKPTQKEMDDLFVEETGFDPDDFPAAIFGFARAVLAKWGQPAVAAEPVAWAATSEDGVVEALGMNQSRRFDTPLYLTPQPVAREPLTEVQINAAGKKMAECMDYPWGHMPEQGRAEMRKHAQAVIEAAHGIKGGQP